METPAESGIGILNDSMCVCVSICVRRVDSVLKQMVEVRDHDRRLRKLESEVSDSYTHLCTCGCQTQRHVFLNTVSVPQGARMCLWVRDYGSCLILAAAVAFACSAQTKDHPSSSFRMQIHFEYLPSCQPIDVINEAAL